MVLGSGMNTLIGRYVFNANTDWFVGFLDEMVLYGRVLSDTDVETLFLSTSVGSVRTCQSCPSAERCR